MPRKTTLADQAAALEDMFDRNRAADPNARVISVRGAREHNLKNVDLAIPRDKLVVFTGLSGSGKSSLAFDTIYAEGQRRYVESLSAYARQFLEMMQKPDIDQIDGLSPAISIEQKTTSKNPRSTVGTVTEIHDYMRLLWARVGIPYSPATGLPIESQTVQQMVDRLVELPEKTRGYLLAPVVRGRKGEFRKEMADWLKRGFQRVKVNGEFYEIPDAPALDKKFKHDIDLVVDRIVIRPDLGARLADSLEQALDLADGIAVFEYADEKKKNGEARRVTFSSKFACPVSGFTIPEIEPRLFSFNNPFGACPACDGLGHEMRIDPEMIVPDHSLSLKKGAIAPWAKSTSPYYSQTLDALAKHFGFSTTKPWSELPQSARDAMAIRIGAWAASGALNSIRIAKGKAAETKTRKKATYRGRHILLKRPSNLTAKQAFALDGMLANDADLREAYEAKERFFQIWDAPDRGSAEMAIDEWMETVPPQHRAAFKHAITALEDWRKEVLTYWGEFPEISNAYTEAANGMAKIHNRKGRGYKFEVIRARVLIDMRTVTPTDFVKCHGCGIGFAAGMLVAQEAVSIGRGRRKVHLTLCPN